MFDLQHKIVLKVLSINLLCRGVKTCIALLNNLLTGAEDVSVELYFTNTPNKIRLMAVKLFCLQFWLADTVSVNK